jgi:hypothetical protein
MPPSSAPTWIRSRSFQVSRYFALGKARTSRVEADVQGDTVAHLSVTIHEYAVPWWGIALIILVVAIMVALVIPLFRNSGGPTD